MIPAEAGIQKGQGMLKRLYVNNHKCLVNFEWRPGPLGLLVGPNGSGKSAVFECLDLLRTFVSGERRADALFVEADLTRWAGEKVQVFEVDVEGNGGTYAYKIHVEVDPGRDRAHVLEENLRLDGKPLFEMKAGEAQLYRDDFTAGPKYPFDWTMSGIGSLLARPENGKLTWFRDYMSRLLVVKINPFAMETESDGEVERPALDMADFASWYRYLSQEEQGKIVDLFDVLRDLLEGFRSLNLPKTGEKRRALRAAFSPKSRGKEIEYGFAELSDGQRVLIALYTMLELCVTTGRTVCIDEPDNFVSLREIQPWLSQLKDRCLEGGGQALLISHHPEIIDYLAGSVGCWMDRPRAEHALTDTTAGRQGRRCTALRAGGQGVDR